MLLPDPNAPARPARPRPAWLALLVGLGLSCGKRPDYERLREHMEQGRIEEVEGALTGLEGQDAETLRALGQRLREHREQVEAEIARVRERRDGMPSSEVLRQLRALLEGERDQSLRQRIEEELSQSLDWASTRPRELDGPPPDLPGRPYEPALEASLEADPQPGLDPLAASDLELVAAAAAHGDWRDALERIEAAQADVDDVAIFERFERERQWILVQARGEAEALLLQLVGLPPEKAGERLREQLANFPDGPELERLRHAYRHVAEGEVLLAADLPGLSARVGVAAAGARPHAHAPAAMARSAPAEPMAELEVSAAPVTPAGPADATAAAPEAALAGFLEQVERASPSELRAQLARLDECVSWSGAERELLQAALGRRHDELLARIERAHLDGLLRDLHETRLELEEARREALEWIEDPARYPVVPAPGLADEATRRTAQLAQAEVERRVERVRGLWEDPQRVRLPREGRALLAEARALRELARERSLTLSAGVSVPEWVLALDPQATELGARELALDDAEAERLAHDRAVLARNEALWSELAARKEPLAPSRHEAAQQRLTNSYRRMLGRSALAWNPALQEAARTHSEFMARVGLLTHDEPEAGRRDLRERLRSFGYEQAVAENCYEGSPLPGPAHMMWCRSSMHHRNLVRATATELACGTRGTYWTQNYGSDRSYEQELDPWRD